MGYCLTGVRVALDHGGLGDGFLFLELLSMLYAYIRVSTEKQTVTLKFDNKYGFDLIQRAQSFGVAGKNITITLEGGEGVMLALR